MSNQARTSLKRKLTLTTTFTSIAAIAIASSAYAADLPQGGSFAGGTSGAIDYNPAGTKVTVTLGAAQTKGIVDWSGFDIADGKRADFKADAGDLIVNRAPQDGNASTIRGSITSDPGVSVWLIDRDGTAFGNSS